MANNEDLNKANDGAPAADIPDLKAKDKERKKAGAAWSGVKPGPGSFSGATGGAARAAASAAGAVGGTAGAAGTFGFSSFLAGLAATMIGKVVLGMAALAFLLGGAMIAASMLKGGGAAGGAVGDLGAISSSMKVRAGGNDRTGYVASNGEIAFDPVKNNAAKPAEKAPADAAPSGDPAVPAAQKDAAEKDAGFNRPGLDHNLSGAKLSSSMGGGDFGSKNIFSGNNASNKLGAAMGKFDIKGADKGHMSATRAASRTGKVAAGGSTRGMKANKAFGQLKVARQSMIGAGSTGVEGAHNAASNAFDGGNLNAASVTGSPTGAAPTGEVTSPSSNGGAPDVTAPGGTMVDDAGANAQNTAAMLAGIASMIDAATKLKKKGENLILIGILMCCSLILLPIGLILIGMGIAMKEMASTMQDMATSMSNQLAAHTTDQRQNKINQYCLDQAKQNGTPVASCKPPDDISGRQGATEDFGSATSDGKKNSDRIIREDGAVEGDNGQPTRP